MLRKFLIAVVANFTAYLLILPNIAIASQLEPLGSEVMDFGTATVDLATGTFSFNNSIRTLSFRNVYSGGGNPEVQKISVYNAYANNFAYNNKMYYTGSPFMVLNHQTGAWLRSPSIFSFDRVINHMETDLAYVSFNPSISHVQHCIDAGQKDCHFGGAGSSRNQIIYYQPYYCVLPTSCVISDGLQLKPQVKVNFLLPEVRTSTDSISFTDVEVGTTEKVSFTVYNDSTNYDFRFVVPNKISAFTIQNPGQSVIIPQASSRTFELSYTPTSAGTHQAQFYINDSRTNVSKVVGLIEVFQVEGSAVQPTSNTPTPTPTPEPDPTPEPSPTPEPDSTNNTGSTDEEPTERDGRAITKRVRNIDNKNPVKVETVENKLEIEVSNILVEASEQGNRILLSGKGNPNTRYMIYIYSDPIIAEVVTDENGNWEYSYEGQIAPGEHTVYMAEMGEDDQLISSPELIAYLTIEKDATSDNDVEADEAQPYSDNVVTQSGYDKTLIILLGSTLVAGVIAGTMYALIKRRK